MHTSLIHLKHQEHITTSRQPCRSNASISTTDAEGERCTCLDYNFSQQNLAFTWTKCTPPKSPQFAGSFITSPARIQSLTRTPYSCVSSPARLPKGQRHRNKEQQLFGWSCPDPNTVVTKTTFWTASSSPGYINTSMTFAQWPRWLVQWNLKTAFCVIGTK